ncbi:hypothetical protein FGG08_005443 [Glutinoglossum americanum]|uniref:Aspartokinase n=1 Tax=Glutinoglossum americanum TaxID=1670608 RepID=A0A9P8L1T7_9PEZI|nr:hypothetical protein FGG08_005443 [Glutinoglossum americanum]
MAYTTNGYVVAHDSHTTRTWQRNTGSGGWIIQKFGGTSIGKFAVNIVEDIIMASLSQRKVVAVCSARSPYSKAEGTTNRLLRAAREAERQGSKNYEKIVSVIREDHVAAARSCARSPDVIESLIQDINDECDTLSGLLGALQTVEEVTTKSEDKIISTGEKLSCRFIAALLRDRGVDSEFVDLSKIVPCKVHDGLNQSFYQDIARLLADRIHLCGDRVPVVTGYFGVVPGGLLNSIGRGYTDLCAALIAVGLKADELQVWKEVDGIFTADPRKVPTARLLSTITPAEAAELTFYGSEVIHPFTMEQAIRARIPIRIKNVMNPRGKGTVIFPDSAAELDNAVPGHEPKLFRTRSSSVLSQHQRPKRPTAVTIKRQILVMNIHSNKRSLSHGFFAKIFSTLDKWRLSVDLIATSEVHVSMALHSESALLEGDIDSNQLKILDRDLHGAIAELRECGTVDIIPHMAILSLVGRQMKNMIGVAGKMFSTLGENNVNIEMISQGASEINISCVIEERDADRAINILHTNLFQFLE